MIKVLEFLKKYWPYVVLLLVGVGLGWYAKPGKVEIHETVKTVEVEKKDTRIDELLTQIATLNKNYDELKNSQTNEKFHKTVVETTATDGSKTKTTTIDKNVQSVVQETKHETEVRVVEVEKQVIVTQTVTVEKEIEKEKIVKPILAQWHVGVLGGVNPALLPTPKINSWGVGGEIERRIVGPVFLGVWGFGTSAGQGLGGIKIGAEF